MTNAASAIANKPAWVDLGTTDTVVASRFYSTLFGWVVRVNPDPLYGGYGRAVLDGKDVAGIGPTMSPQQPVAWSVYIGTDDAEAVGHKVEGVDAAAAWYRCSDNYLATDGPTMKAFALLDADNPAAVVDLPDPEVAPDGVRIRVTAA